MAYNHQPGPPSLTATCWWFPSCTVPPLPRKAPGSGEAVSAHPIPHRSAACPGDRLPLGACGENGGSSAWDRWWNQLKLRWWIFGFNIQDHVFCAMNSRDLILSTCFVYLFACGYDFELVDVGTSWTARGRMSRNMVYWVYFGINNVDVDLCNEIPGPSELGELCKYVWQYIWEIVPVDIVQEISRNPPSYSGGC